MYKIQLSKEAVKYYKKSDKDLKQQLNECFNMIAENPYNNPNIKRLQGELNGLFRYRIGSMRVIY